MIIIDLTKCTGCRRCETVCAFYHTGKVSNRIARIKVVNLYENGLDGPVVCQQCEERYCLQCPVDAISIGSLGQVIIAPTICTLCRTCERNCPIGAIEQFNAFIYVCDLCGGRPKCVEACTEGAIIYVHPAPKVSLAGFHQQTKNMTPSEKRRLFIEHHGIALRKQWENKNHANRLSFSEEASSVLPLRAPEKSEKTMEEKTCRDTTTKEEF